MAPPASAGRPERGPRSIMDPVTIIGSVAIAVVAITTHEAAHAYVADRLGDPTARMLGRVTLNPVPHIDLFMTILLPGFLLLAQAPFLFGGAKPVPVDLRRLRRPMRDWALVGIAGPLSNLLQAVLWAGLLSLVLRTGIWSEDSVGVAVLQLGIFVNILLMVFNLVPIPPLDGSRAVMYFLKGNALRSYVALERYGIYILLGLLFFVPWTFRALWFVISHVAYYVGMMVGLPISPFPAYLFT